ncbi:MAG: acyl-CoA dehydrogenase [Actinomycetia bacterium]|nr:acyl-CoA dehydrogenase [Actinomycetes bacterium]MCP4224240.1 acyl-CoA dehydrogenase [Actinomycetes bacterium]MCP5031848.1 acyl-CoA dehydrogenase [Actinomycetes bacterium]
MADGSTEPSADEVRDEVGQWLEVNWDPDRELLEWRNLLVDSGWGCPTWPIEWFGRGLPPSVDRAVQAEFERVGAVGVAAGVSMYLVAPTLLEHGSSDLLDRLLRPILTGEHKWCQLFSEPGAGSDLAGLTTRAERDGDEWIVNGQKVWNSGAHKAAFGILIARTEWDAPKHRGLSYFALPMDQDEVEVRPLQQMNRHASFNEVFFSDARVSHDNLIGATGEGWRVALTTLAHERAAVATRRPKFARDGGRCVDQARAESDAYFATYRWYPQRAGRANMLVSEAERRGRVGDPLVRQELAAALSLRDISGWTTDRARAARRAGKPPGPEGSLAKLHLSDISRLSHTAHTSIVGTEGMLTGADAPKPEGRSRAPEEIVAEVLISTPAQSIAGGTDEIQRNIIGERVLGLPKEPDDTIDQPFRQVRTNQ